MKRTRIDVADAERLIMAAMPTLPCVQLPIDEATGSVLREPVRAERDQPPFDRVTMDGIAIQFDALQKGGRAFGIHGTQGAGAPALTLPDGQSCIEIMTGAKLPPGADTVIPVERTRRDGDHIHLTPEYQPEAGQFIHRQASDYQRDELLLESGCLLGPTEIATLTIGGHATIAVAQRPAIAVVSTGDELIDAGKPITDFQIRSSNGVAIAASLQTRGFREIAQAHLPDNPDALRREIARLHRDNDVLILSGGVSMGKYDYVPQILEELAIDVVFHKILQRPGLPMWFGTSADGKPVFALPGNPVSTLVCLTRYVLPALYHAMGAAPRRRRRVALGEDAHFEPDLSWFLPVRLESREGESCRAWPRPTNTSGDFVSLTASDGFVELPRENPHFPAGFIADFHAW